MKIELLLLLVVLLGMHFAYIILQRKNEKAGRDITAVGARVTFLLAVSTITVILALTLVDAVVQRRFEKNSQNDSTKCSVESICKQLNDLDKKVSKKDTSDYEKEFGKVLEKLDSMQKRLSALDDSARKTSIQPAATESSPGSISFVWIFLILVFFLGTMLAVFMWIWKKFDLKWFATATISSLLTISSLALFSIEHMDGKFDFFGRTNNYFQGIGTDSVNEARDPKLIMAHLGDVGGFETGSYMTFNPSDFETLVKKCEAVSASVLIVIGEVDHRELNDNLKSRLGSNITLARARAEKISASLEARLDKPLVLTLSRGAMHPGNASQWPLDRKVSVYGMKVE